MISKNSLLSLIALIFLFALIIGNAKSKNEDNNKKARQTGYSIKADSSLIEATINYAISQVGEIKISENNSPMIKEYLKSVGIKSPANYCAAGIYWSLYKAKDKLLLNNSDIPIPKSGVANEHYNYAKQKGQRYYGKIERGDLVVWRRPNSWQGHIEIVINNTLNNKENKIETVGFNSSKKINGRRIEGVWKQKRMPNHPLGRLKYRGVVHFDKSI